MMFLIASFLLAPLSNSIDDFFCFIGLAFFKKEKKRACCIFMFFFTELLHDFDAHSKPNVFKMFLW